MSTQIIDLTAVITPKPGKAEKVFELFSNCVNYSEANEPGTLRYEIHRGLQDKNGGLEEFVVRETYADEDAMNKHMVGPDVVALVKAMETGDLVENVKVIHTKPGAGYERSKI
ncbi:hypothetical protein CkaCkLH20_09809 [Colletotrichum karsti]|uniref:ABM domain-containing protein n=1 Tax=Colletotrichum karsti TaxID=1095194 RepID=A0A9P6HYR6_9PEZI|nr:uncharacterized protein CkaCkLH20_09809 [Colletotrichum karsti]KAF9872630.1 hypothetical protein CkaCkLH20_09809 [Colletotrichum karsti]